MGSITNAGYQGVKFVIDTTNNDKPLTLQRTAGTLYKAVAEAGGAIYQVPAGKKYTILGFFAECGFTDQFKIWEHTSSSTAGGTAITPNIFHMTVGDNILVPFYYEVSAGNYINVQLSGNDQVDVVLVGVEGDL